MAILCLFLAAASQYCLKQKGNKFLLYFYLTFYFFFSFCFFIFFCRVWQSKMLEMRIEITTTQTVELIVSIVKI